MTTMSVRIALRRPVLRAFFQHAWHWMQRHLPTHTPPLTDRQARDAGLTTAELERLRFEWPSQSNPHLML